LVHGPDRRQAPEPLEGNDARFPRNGIQDEDLDPELG
jgi:hypothetical protein